jgi:hypothetical protein
MSKPELMCLETIRNLGELNRLLILAGEFRRRDDRASRKRLQQAIQEQAFQGGPAPFNDLLLLALHFRLINIHEDSVSITPFGQTFLTANPNDQYLLTEAQTHLLVQSILFGRTPISNEFEKILGDFSFNTITQRFDSYNQATSGRFPALGIRLLCSALGFLNETEDGARYFDPIFNTDIARRIRILRNTGSDGQVPSDETLVRSKHAEELIYYYEKVRLESEGFPEMSRRVQLVSDYNSAAGFDVQSYDGIGSRPEIPDRFIEVKSSRQKKVQFFMTTNEQRRARELRQKYRITFVGNHDINKQLAECYIKEIIDPMEEIFTPGKYDIEYKKLHVIEKGLEGAEISE